MRLREFSKMYTVNNGSRLIFESIVSPEVTSALQDWAKNNGGGVLVGGLALSFYVRPRTTQDIDLLFLNESSIPTKVIGFKRTRAHAFQHDKTHVEIELVTPALVKIPQDVIQQIIASAVVSQNVKIASASGLVVSKLFRLSFQDKADIVALIKTGKIDITGFSLHPDKVSAYERLVTDAKADEHPP